MSGPSAALRTRILRAAAERPSPTRIEVRRLQRRMVMLGATVVGAGALMHGVPEPSPDRPWLYIVISAGGALLAALLGSALVLTRRAAPGPSRALLGKLSMLGPMVVVGAVLGATFAAPGAPVWPANGDVLAPLCLTAYLVLGAALLGLAAVSLGRSDPVAPRTTGAVAGAAVGAWASFAMVLQCPCPLVGHVLVNHVAPAGLFVALGVALGKRWFGLGFRVRSRQESPRPR